MLLMSRSGQHAVIINRNRQASMVLPGETLLICEMVPALYAAIAANEAEKAAPGLTLVDVQMIGAAGRLYMSGSTENVNQGLARIEQVLASIEGRVLTPSLQRARYMFRQVSLTLLRVPIYSHHQM